jgi:hypothetical protein
MIINQEQGMAVLRWALTTLGSTLATAGVVSASSWALISGALIAAAPFIWALISNTQAATVAKAAAIPGVTAHVSDAAPEAVKQLAADPANASVVPAK